METKKSNIVITLVLLLTSTFSLIAQEKFDEYYSEYFKKSYQIELVKNDGKFKFYIETATLDKTSKKAYIILKDAELGDFKEFFQGINETYTKWKGTAEENKVTELDKKIESKRLKVATAFSYGSKFEFDFSAQLTARVKIIEGKILLIVNSDKLESSSNQFMTNDGLYFVFNSPTEVEEFLSKLDEEKALKQSEEKKKTEELFKE